ncbi:nitroreductase family deazaflavin-dependent oxidoreductase [Actinosynnema pretiosum subsp. pretiosum]|uniref:Nitroreductase family deazaflavin-dependent oxidoreductase n=1 Tax=Actinosynnema pretiosum subsp. pretiosum TaxID=103721 RepID=A0AA45L8P8_9PSEU|nr:AclJ [Actinosynnema pretiosum subsp. pretiosum]QUF04843.1 nitroreductase family deazaflavin-dependent oxidoreductase [Actinosynnema pretiosum subsp. pretiosum]
MTDAFKQFNQQVIDEFRANAGRVGGMFEGGRLLLLTTTGARTGAKHTNPVGYLPDVERVLVIASAGGAPKHPDWYLNLVANPRVTVENGVFTYEADAEVLRGEERARMFARAVEADPGWGAYQEKTTRVLPVVALNPVPGPPTPNEKSMSGALLAVHDAFRRELALVRKEIRASGGTLGAQLRVNCLTVCAGLHNHHTGEDLMLFPHLRHRYPEMEPVMDRLAREHEAIAALLARLKEAVAGGGAGVADEVDRLAEELEAHLRYEEENLIPLLG